jgi:hypothetical protein
MTLHCVHVVGICAVCRLNARVVAHRGDDEREKSRSLLQQHSLRRNLKMRRNELSGSAWHWIGASRNRTPFHRCGYYNVHLQVFELRTIKLSISIDV